LPARTRVMISPVTNKLTTYAEHSALMTCEVGTPYPPESLMAIMNSNIANGGYDAFVDEIKVYYEVLDTNVEAHLWIAEQSPIGAITALVILGFLVAACYTIWLISSSAQTIIEHFWPRAKFYQYDSEGRAIIVETLAEYITCQRATHPGEYVCGWCGQVFPTAEERDIHQETCPWQEGVPNGDGDWTGLIVLALGAITLVAGIWVVGKIFTRKKGPPIMVIR